MCIYRWHSGKESACQCRRHKRGLDWEDPLEKEMASHSSILAWEIPWTEQPGRLQSMGSQSQSQLSIHTHTHTHTGCVFLTNGKLVLKVWVDFRLNIILVHLHAKSLQLCPTFCDPVDCSPPCSSVHGISQATILELGCSNKITVDWVAYKQQNFSQIWRLEVWDKGAPMVGWASPSGLQ